MKWPGTVDESHHTRLPFMDFPFPENSKGVRLTGYPARPTDQNFVGHTVKGGNGKMKRRSTKHERGEVRIDGSEP